MRTYKGKIPQFKPCIGKSYAWSLFRLSVKKNSNGQDEYVHVKLMSNYPREGKANWWLQWSISLRRFHQTRYTHSLEKWALDGLKFAEAVMLQEYNVVPLRPMKKIRIMRDSIVPM